MECEKIKIWLSAYLDGEIDPEMKSSVEKHLKECESCRKDLDLLKDYLYVARDIPRSASPEELKDRTWQRLSLPEKTPLIVRMTRNRSIQLVSSLAAAAIIILYIAITPNFVNTAHIHSDFAYEVIKKGKGPGETRGVMKDESKEVQMLKQYTEQADGEVLDESFNDLTGMIDYIIIRIPGKNYENFRAALAEAGVEANLPGEFSPVVRYIAIQMYFPGRKFLAGDVNGDGRSDIAAYFKRGKHTGQWYVSFQVEDAEFSDPERMKVGDSTVFLKDFMVPLFFDLNGDGSCDLLISSPGEIWETFVNNGNNTFTRTSVNIPINTLPRPEDPYVPLTGDLNGDNYDDAVVHYLKGELAGRWFVSLNEGGHDFGSFREFTFEDDEQDYHERYFPFILDFNGDGFDDAGIYWQQGELIASWFIGINNQKGGFHEHERTYFGNSPLAFMGDYIPFTGDFNGDGYDDLLVKSGTQDETGEWNLQYNVKGEKFTYGFNVTFGKHKDFTLN